MFADFTIVGYRAAERGGIVYRARRRISEAMRANA